MWRVLFLLSLGACAAPVAAKSPASVVAIDATPASAPKPEGCEDKLEPDRLRCLAERAVKREGELFANGDRAGASAERQKAIRLYRELADRFAAQIDLGEVLYLLAYEHEQDGAKPQAMAVYRELLENAPNSKYAANAHVAFGEEAFTKAESDPSAWSAAIAEFRAALADPESRVFGYAEYKLAYCHWNQNDYREALAAFEKTIVYARTHTSMPGAANLGRAARKDIVPVYALVGDPQRAFDFFLHATGERDASLGMLDELGAAFMDTGKPADAVAAYRALADHDETHAFCGSVQRQADALTAMPGQVGKDAADLAAVNRARCPR